MIGMSKEALSHVGDTASLRGGAADLIPGPLVGRKAKGRSRRSIAKSREKLALISSIATLGFWSWNAATGRFWASTHTRRILGFDEHIELTRESLLAALHPSDRATVLRTIMTPETADGTLEMELRVVGTAATVGSR